MTILVPLEHSRGILLFKGHFEYQMIWLLIDDCGFDLNEDIVGNFFLWK